MNCNSIEIVQKCENGVLGGQKGICLDINNVNIKVTQCRTRIIRLSHLESVEFDVLYYVFCLFEKLCVLCEGQYLEIEDLKLYDGNGKRIENAISCKELKSKRLNCCHTMDALKGDLSKLVNIFDFLNTSVLQNWIKLENELDIIHQSFLYNTSSIGLPVDGKIASIIETFEPLIELITLYTNQFSSLRPGERGTTLKMCLDTCISVYGEDIFKTEYSINHEKFLKCLIESRNKIMHIKRNNKTICFSGEESVLYIVKLSFLYRRILLTLLDIDYSIYREKMIRAVQKWEKWNNVFQSFIDNKLR